MVLGRPDVSLEKKSGDRHRRGTRLEPGPTASASSDFDLKNHVAWISNIIPAAPKKKKKMPGALELAHGHGPHAG